jgi:hypothetical protein
VPRAGAMGDDDGRHVRNIVLGLALAMELVEGLGSVPQPSPREVRLPVP